MNNQTIHNAVDELKSNLTDVARVFEWADLMGYEDPKRFSEKFLRHYGVRPQKIMELIRLESIIRYLRSNENLSNYKIARMHSLPCEKTLNNFTNYHTGYSPTALKEKSKEEIGHLMEGLWSKIMEEYAVGKTGIVLVERRYEHWRETG
ncbi:AraC family transcriptional regulator [Balneolaceae bacterium YR4-1]|uniref:AraC family transcriptional regulator n=1 Tax=Halalkalibaculum roseum TaxID=2709311 RepID=A0A6M1SSM2_9BACT|nr:AraC family transcriptional regulator [Halalkalibaculum roseum]NGP75762.1 AraC family transcriptional regulator [Halalkalibaculum roseum]